MEILLGEDLKEKNDKKEKSLSLKNSLPLEKIIPDPNQPRKTFKKGSIEELSISIKNQGLLVPIIVRKTEGDNNDKYMIIAGERRWRASKMAGLSDINVIIENNNNKNVALTSLIENVQREDLNPIEEAEGYYNLVKKYKMKHEEISKYTGKSRSYITNLIRIISLPKNVKSMLMDGKISFGHARSLLGDANAENTAKLIIKENLSVRETESIVKKGKAEKNTYKKITKDTNILDYEKYLSIKLGYKVQISDNNGKGRISVSYNTLDQLEEIIKFFNS